ncbi:HNH endonuclease [Bacillus oleivorans]|uniref:HNH endonuclease n=1 Tax=Bacillus oleivorans TaxID=1448271 RepID=A0A285D813_9BACI|nr:HNH endonuclease signature motif containing protein [Bacillus oleivorans]SNX75959.1 HNH endonuclease [Bacillus oleivorans]
MKICTVANCEKKVLAKGLCNTHYWRKYRTGDPTKLINQPRSKYKHCKAADCYREVFSKGYCRKHYKRLYKHGDVNTVHDKRAIPIDFVVDENGCFNCTSHKRNKFGYPLVGLRGKSSPMYRKIYEEMFGDIPEGLCIRHKCDNPQCINPEHLELGTHFDNMQDKVKRGRQPRGEDIYSHVLTEEEVIEIKKLLNMRHILIKDIAKIYGVNPSTIGDIKNGRTWKHLSIS